MTYGFTKAVAAAIALSFAVGTALPAFAQNAPVFFDLGIDVTQLPQDTAGATKYFAAQPPETQRVLLAACHTYITHPTDAAMPQTLVFCKAINAK
jgi:hypothetical protein